MHGSNHTPLLLRGIPGAWVLGLSLRDIALNLLGNGFFQSSIRAPECDREGCVLLQVVRLWTALEQIGHFLEQAEDRLCAASHLAAGSGMYQLLLLFFD